MRWPFRKKHRPDLTSKTSPHDPVLRAVEPWRARHRRTAWRPVIGADETLSQFGGAPSIPATEPRPACGGCGRPIDLFLQLDGRHTPEGSPWSGPHLLQLFYCRDCESSHDGWAPFSKAHLVRSLSTEPTLAPVAATATALPRKGIVGWTPLDDFPNAGEQSELGLSLEYDFKANTLDVSCPEIGVHFTGLDTKAQDGEGRELAEALSDAAAGDKLGGWPYWVQGVEYPNCPRCAARMALIFQLDSENNLDYMFGDVGCGHVTRCLAHPDVLAFGWACS